MQVVGRPLQTAAAPAGIVSFRFAGTPENAQQMLASWGPDQRVRAGLLYVLLGAGARIGEKIGNGIRSAT